MNPSGIGVKDDLNVHVVDIRHELVSETWPRKNTRFCLRSGNGARKANMELVVSILGGIHHCSQREFDSLDALSFLVVMSRAA